MSTSLLEKAYNPDLFKKDGHAIIELLHRHLSSCLNETNSVTKWRHPEEELAFWKAYQPTSTESFFETVLERSIHTHHPKYIGHQVAPTVPVSGLATLLSAQLNNGMAVYEMGQASTALEKIVIDQFCQAIGWKQGDGFLTSGGTLGNLTGLLAARKAIAKTDVWNEGHQQKLAIMVSEEAHYCVDRAARIMGLGEQGIIKVPVDAHFKIRTDLLDQYYQEATQKGLQVIAIIGSGPSTSTGVYDDFKVLSAFAKANAIWFHIDGAHGGAAIFSKKYKHLLAGVQDADSIIIDGHKMMGTSSITTAVLYKNTADSYATFDQQAQYLWEQNEDPEWFNMAKRTFECTKSMMSLRFYAILNAHGMAFFDDFVTHLYDAGRNFGNLVDEQADFELFLTPQSNIVCFRYTNKGQLTINALNKKIRQQLLEDGEFYIVATQLNGDYYLRTTFMNPFTTEDHTVQLLQKIRTFANTIKNKDL